MYFLLKYSSSYYVQLVSDLLLTNVISSVESMKMDVVNTGLPMCVPVDERIVLQGLLKMFFVKLELCRALLVKLIAEFAEFFS